MTTLSINDLNGSLNNQIESLNLNSNRIWNLVDTKQDRLTASTRFVGNGANITKISYKNLIKKPSLFDGTWTSLSGKPTNFQADWNTTIINKPSLFDGTWTSLSGKHGSI